MNAPSPAPTRQAAQQRADAIRNFRAELRRLERLTSDPQNKTGEDAPRYAASLAVGRRLEPWTTSLTLVSR